ncbi:putative pectate lyase 2 [Punica granatum]|nr:putative pectate lyase 2 [Punica granatum]
MSGNIGEGVVSYTVTDPGDDPLNPRPGTLRYGATMIKGKVWISFSRDMTIKLANALYLGSFTTIDGRGATVHIAGGACLVVHEVHDVIIHGLHIHDCQPQNGGRIMGPGGKVMSIIPVDGDGIRVMTSSKVWIDHNTLSRCQDGLVDVTRGSTGITISNNQFTDQDKVMLLGHVDGHAPDKNMKVTVIYNHFGPNCDQRMPRVRNGYAHVANNLYEGWGWYAIGGSSSPTIESEANVFIPTKNKEVIWKGGSDNSGRFYSVGDLFENGATFARTGQIGSTTPNYSPDQRFQVANADSVRNLTMSAGAQKL